ncbi:dienelactone hydrolase family protein [Gynuella sunshinyii]|nr:dienelactone hydrolase family protein [Gynuella sunshinyii]
MSEVIVKPIAYEHEGRSFEGRLVYVEGSKPTRGLLMAPNFKGISPLAIEVASEQVKQDSVILVLDPYGVEFHSASVEALRDEMQRLAQDNAGLRSRLQAAYEVLKTEATAMGVNADNLAVFGFCFGGACILEMARAGVPMKAFVSLHGLLQTPNPEQSKTPAGPVLVLNGADDPLVPEAERLAFEAEMTRIGADWQLVNFGKTLHAFTDPYANMPGRTQYNPVVARRAFAMMHDLFDEVLA